MNGVQENDLQRELERRALRNVRGLVDKLEETDKADTRTQRRIVAGLLVLVVVVGLAFVLIPTKPETVVIDPSKLPPVRGGPPR